jgi:REP element-mobilizing transposase RayT
MNDAEKTPFVPMNRESEIDFSCNRLPHWEQNRCTYFVTFRLADAFPQPLLDQWDSEREAWMKIHPPPWTEEVEIDYHQRFSNRLEEALDAGHGSCVLREPENSAIVSQALKFFEGERCNQLAWVVMPNHVHVLFSVIAPWKLAQVIHSWKSYSSKAINAKTGKTGTFWQKDYFDRLIRDSAHLARCVRYIRRNGEKGKLRPTEFLRWESEFATKIS